ncbi:hypothetical protein QQF64_026625 [Cirrhinus molitorella]|uniref:Uncharacterized protein n=1 Tax=Cirrhinus molitorella TaxID=172907 RepID=A0ABR3NAF0_9TELE
MVHILHLAVRSLGSFEGLSGMGMSQIECLSPGWRDGREDLIGRGARDEGVFSQFSAAYMRSGWWTAHPHSNTFFVLPPLDWISPSNRKETTPFKY